MTPRPGMTTGASDLTIVLVGRTDPAQVAELCSRLHRLFEHASCPVVTVDLITLAPCDLSTVHLLTRLQLAARRQGRTIALRHLDDDLRGLLELTGLTACFDTARTSCRATKGGGGEHITGLAGPSGA
jgi:ABC-type transporter Mla MlaB component